jgi:hypothetical protein
MLLSRKEIEVRGRVLSLLRFVPEFIEAVDRWRGELSQTPMAILNESLM